MQTAGDGLESARVHGFLMLGVDPAVIWPLWHVCSMLILRFFIDYCGEDGLVSAILLNILSSCLVSECKEPLGLQQLRADSLISRCDRVPL